MNGIAYGPGLRLRAVASSNGATTCLAPRGQGLFLLRTSTPSPLRSLTGPKWSQHCLDPRCEQFLLDAIAAPIHASPPESSRRNSGAPKSPKSPNPSTSGIINLVCSVRLSPRYARFYYVCPDPRSFRVSLSEKRPTECVIVR